MNESHSDEKPVIHVSGLPLVSVITATLNRLDYLPECVESVLEQTYPNVEHVIADGASTDGSVEYLRSIEARHPGRIRWISEKDDGISQAMNRCIALTRGELIIWIGSDDKLLPDAVERAVAYFAVHTEAQWIYGIQIEIGSDGSYRRTRNAPDYDYNRFRRTGYLCGPSIFYRKSLIDRVGPMGEQYRYAMDMEWNLRMAQISAPHKVDQPFAMFRWHPGSITMRMRSRQLDESKQFILALASGPIDALYIRAYLAYAKMKAFAKRILYYTGVLR